MIFCQNLMLRISAIFHIPPSWKMKTDYQRAFNELHKIRQFKLRDDSSHNHVLRSPNASSKHFHQLHIEFLQEIDANVSNLILAKHHVFASDNLDQNQLTKLFADDR